MIPIIGFANEVISATSSISKIEHFPLPEDDPKVRQPDISRAMRLLNWKPKVSLRDGLALTIPYFEKALRSAEGESVISQ